MKEFSRYRAVYCGLCKALSTRYGQVPRLALTYDFTFFALLFLSLSEAEATIKEEGCILNPIQKRPVAKDHDVLDLTADCTVLLAGYQLRDDVADEGTVKAKLRAFLFNGAFKKAKSRLPALTATLEAKLLALTEKEKDKAPDDESVETVLSYAAPFAEALAAMFSYAAQKLSLEAEIVSALEIVGSDLGAWIYLIDALDDFTKDKERGRFNPLGRASRDEAVSLLRAPLIELEAALDRTLALLPYRRDGGIMRNIALEGLSSVRTAVEGGFALGKI